MEETNPNAKTKLEARNVRSKRRIAKRAKKFRRIVKRRAENARNKHLRLMIRQPTKKLNTEVYDL